MVLIKVTTEVGTFGLFDIKTFLIDTVKIHHHQR